MGFDQKYQVHYCETQRWSPCCTASTTTLLSLCVRIANIKMLAEDYFLMNWVVALNKNQIGKARAVSSSGVLHTQGVPTVLIICVGCAVDYSNRIYNTIIGGLAFLYAFSAQRHRFQPSCQIVVCMMKPILFHRETFGTLQILFGLVQ